MFITVLSNLLLHKRLTVYVLSCKVSLPIPSRLFLLPFPA